MLGSDDLLADYPTGGEHAWSPDAFTPIASALVNKYSLSPSATSQPLRSPLDALTDLRASVLVAESKRLSSRLAKEPLLADAHEQAALLLGAFGLREAAGRWSDRRQVLSAMSARLALASVLRGQSPLGSDAAYAIVVLDTLAGRERPALAGVAALRASPHSSNAWLNALLVRNNYDWRVIKNVAAATLLERLAQSWALTRARGPLYELAFLGQRRPEAIPDWGLIAVQSTFPVEVGNAFVPSLLPSVQMEMAAVWKSLFDKELPDVQPLSTLTEHATGPPHEVLSWSLWAGFFERHLMQAAEASWTQYQHKLGLPEEARTLQVLLEKQFAPLPNRPLIESVWKLQRTDAQHPGTTSAERIEVCAQAAERVRTQPDEVPISMWSWFLEMCPREKGQGRLPSLAQWYTSAVPRGTAYLAEGRLYPELFGSEHATFEQTGALLALRVCSPRIVRAHRKDMHVGPSQEEFVEHCGAALDYDTDALKWMLRTAEGAGTDNLDMRRRLCNLEVDACLDLGERLAVARLDDEAAGAYRKAVKGSGDQIALSGELDFLIDYEFDRGRTDSAAALAIRAGNVYSAAGLRTLGRFYERCGRYADAEQVYHQIAKRYEDTYYLNSFFIRYARREKDGRDAAQATEATKAVFPGGLRSAAAADFRVGPHAMLLGGSGWRLEKPSPEQLHFGIKANDTILTIDGYRVENEEQFACVSSFTDDYTTKMLVWRTEREDPNAAIPVWRGSVVEISGDYRRRHYGPRVTR